MRTSINVIVSRSSLLFLGGVVSLVFSTAGAAHPVSFPQQDSGQIIRQEQKQVKITQKKKKVQQDEEKKKDAGDVIEIQDGGVKKEAR